jgi:hypothetical protein
MVIVSGLQRVQRPDRIQKFMSDVSGEKSFPSTRLRGNWRAKSTAT